MADSEWEDIDYDMNEIDKMVANAYPQAHGTLCYLLTYLCRNGAAGLLSQVMPKYNPRQNFTRGVYIYITICRRTGLHTEIVMHCCSLPADDIILLATSEAEL